MERWSILTNNIGIIIQCRDTSTRLPRKSVIPFDKHLSILHIIINRFKHLSYPIVVATTRNSKYTIQIAHENNVPVHIGGEINILENFFHCTKYYHFNGVFRVCADNPFIQLGLMWMIKIRAETNAWDYISYNGMDIIM